MGVAGISCPLTFQLGYTQCRKQKLIVKLQPILLQKYWFYLF